MAATTIKPYPHIQINVKDNSIATIEYVERLPVHRALYVMRTKKGPIGDPIWCNTYSEAAAIFGAETFDPANKEYFSRPSLYLRNTLTRNGAFITRYLPTRKNPDYDPNVAGSKEYLGQTAGTVLMAEIISYEVNEQITEENPNQYNSIRIPQYVYSAGSGYREQVAKKLDEDVPDADATYEWVDKLDETKSPQAGIKIRYSTLSFEDAGLEVDPVTGEIITDIDSWLNAFVPTQQTGNGTPASVGVVGFRWVLPIAIFKAKNPGAYGNDLGFKLFYTPKSNDPGDVGAYNTLFYNIGFVEREDNMSTWYPVTDIYGRENCAFAVNPDTVNPDTGASMGIDYVLDKGFSDSLHILPVDFEVFESSLKKIGIIIAAFEDDEADASGNLITAASLNGYDPYGYVGALTANEKSLVQGYLNGGNSADQNTATMAIFEKDLGYRVNAISAKNLLNVPYDHVIIDTTDLALIYSEVQNLTGGHNGDYVPEDGGPIDPVSKQRKWASDDEAMYNFCKLRLPKLKDKIVESLRYPLTHLFDIGYSMKTKKAMLDFLDIRDDVVVILSAQVLLSDGSARAIKVYEKDPAEAQAQDEANTEALRSYALLMRESVLYGTDCMRASIYEHTGKLVDSVYDGFVPFTYWVAEQYAQFGNLTYMSQSEPRGLPNSYNLLFKSWNWNNYRADSQSRVWDEGGNYVQYADMTRIFYPSLRTVYRAATSVLIDEWVVASVVYAKYVCRRAWARFSGRNDYASTLQNNIKEYLDTELANLFNGKYSFNTTVYQTAEEKELGYIQHVKLSITYGATMRVLDVDIEVNREGFTPGE